METPRPGPGRITAFVVAASAAIVTACSWRHAEISYQVDPSNPDVRTVESHSEETTSRESFRRERWREVRIRGDEWAMDGFFVQWNRSEQKIAQGTYRMGKRHGLWSFWNEDGSIDAKRSGIYEDDEWIGPGASPMGDFDDEPAPPPGYTDR